MSIWPNFRSPLLWDVFAVSTYATVSLLLGITSAWCRTRRTLRDRAKDKPRQIIYGILALAARASRHRKHYEAAYLCLAGRGRRWSSRFTRW